MQVGIIGLGAMGRAMARNLAAAGHSVVAWNRLPAKIEGVAMATDPAEALRGDAAMTMLSDDAAISATLLGSDVLRSARTGLVHVVSSTISVAFARELARRHAEAGSATCPHPSRAGPTSPRGAS